MTSTLTPAQRDRVDRAKAVLGASRADTDPGNYPRHLGRLDVVLGDLIKILDGDTE